MTQENTTKTTPECECAQEQTSLAVQDRGEPLSTDHRPREKVSERWYRPELDLFELPDRYELHVDLPGATRESIDVSVDGGLLTIEASVPDRWPENGVGVVDRREYGVGSFRRRVRLGEDIDPDSIEARFVNGVLELRLPKRAEHRPRRIEISHAE